jgi:hypothetical protein
LIRYESVARGIVSQVHMRLFNLERWESHPRGEPENHLFLLDQLLRFIGAVDRAPLAMFPRPWLSIRGKLGQVAYGVYFLVSVLLDSKSKVLIYGVTDNMLDGEVVFTNRTIRGTAFRCAFSMRPFLICRTNELHPVERACGLIGVDVTQELRAYLSRNPLIVIFALKEGRSVVVHLSASKTASERLERHRRGLEVAGKDPSLASIRRLIPELISFSVIDGVQVLSQSRLRGVPLEFTGISDVAFRTALDHALKPLFDFRSTTAKPGGGADRELIFDKFQMIFEGWPELAEIVEALLSRLQTWQRERSLAPVLTHGDYWLPNILFDKISWEVTGIVDWEWCRAEGTPGLDALYLVVSSLIERDGELADYRYLKQVWMQQCTGLLAEYVAKIQSVYGLNADDICHLAALLFLSELYQLYVGKRFVSKKRMADMQELRPMIESWLAGFEVEV